MTKTDAITAVYVREGTTDQRDVAEFYHLEATVVVTGISNCSPLTNCVAEREMIYSLKVARTKMEKTTIYNYKIEKQIFFICVCHYRIIDSSRLQQNRIGRKSNNSILYTYVIQSKDAV